MTATEARKLHETSQQGDGCWNDDTCHSRRSYYRKGRGRSAQRNLAIEEVSVPIPDFPYVVLHTYLDKPREPNDEVVIHAICAELWIGSTPKAMTQPQHTFGLPPRSVKEYAKQLLEALYLKYGNGRRSGFERFARSEQQFNCSVSCAPLLVPRSASKSLSTVRL